MAKLVTASVLALSVAAACGGAGAAVIQTEADVPVQSVDCDQHGGCGGEGTDLALGVLTVALISTCLVIGNLWAR